MSDYDDRWLESILYTKKKEPEVNVVKRGGIGFCSLLAIVFITLKLAGIGAVASWSWWWVLSPLWIPAAVALLFIILILAAYVIYN